jgi:hypothetical protein
MDHPRRRPTATAGHSPETTMNDHETPNDVYRWFKLSLGLCAAWVVLMVGLMMLISRGDVLPDGNAAPLRIAAQTAAPTTDPSPRAHTRNGDDAGIYHGARLVTGTQPSEPGPLQQ